MTIQKQIWKSLEFGVILPSVCSAFCFYQSYFTCVISVRAGLLSLFFFLISKHLLGNEEDFPERNWNYGTKFAVFSIGFSYYKSKINCEQDKYRYS